MEPTEHPTEAGGARPTAGPACPRCAAPRTPGGRFCSACGAPLPAVAPALAAPGVAAPVVAVPAGHGVERRRVSVLFADLSGFTAMTERFEPEDVRTTVDSFLVAARAAVEACGGRIDQYLGDGVMAVFGDPVAREDDAERAVRAALGIRDATRALATPVARPEADPLRAHVGVATGMAVTADGTNALGVTAPMGTAVNLAARLGALAVADEILVCASTAQLVGGVVATTPLGDRGLKGLDRAVAVHRVDGLGRASVPARPLSALAGRRTELAALSTAVATLVDEGRGVTVVVTGEAGAGKTRLVDEVRRAAGREIVWLEGRGRSLGVATPYGPVVEVIGALAGIDEHHDATERRRRVARLVDGCGLTDADVVGPLHRLLAVDDPGEDHLDREGYQGRLRVAVTALLTAVAGRRPTVVCIQDLHWIDPSTLSLLRSIVPTLQRSMVFLLNSRQRREAMLVPDAVEIHLTELGPSELAVMIGSRLDAPAHDTLVDLVAERSGGNAFFAEEVLNRLVDERHLHLVDGRWAPRPGAGRDDVPGTVQGVIAARLDGLPAAARRQLRHAAVFGRDFTTEDLRGLEPDVDPGDALAVLQGADLVRRVGRAEDGERAERYEFKHALTLDVARASLTKDERRRLHRSAARSIEARTAGREVEFADVLGLHHLEAGDVAPAVHHLSVAAGRALERYAVDEADELYGLAYRLLTTEATDAERRHHLGGLLVDWVLVHYYRGTWRHATDLLARHDADVDGSDDARVRGMALAWRGFSAAIARASIAEALELLDRAVAIGVEADDADVLAHAHTWRIWARFLGGRHLDALADGERVDALVDRLVDRRYVSIKSAGAVGLALIGLGRFADARRTAHWLIATGTATGSTRATSMGQSVLSLAATVTGDVDAGAAHGRDGVANATDPIYRDMARLMALHGLVAAGCLDEARAMHADLLDSCTSLGLDGLVLAASSAHGVLRVLAGDLTGGMAELDDAIDRADLAGSHFLASLGRVYRVSVRARAVTREVEVPWVTVLRNPRFVARHAVPARRHGVAELEQLLDELPARGGAGLRGLVSVELAKLLAARGEHARAAEVRERARVWMSDPPSLLPDGD